MTSLVISSKSRQFFISVQFTMNSFKDLVVLSIVTVCFIYGGEARCYRDEKVNVKLYYETMCPDCRDIVLHEVYPTYKKLSNIMDLELIPYGKVKTRKDGSKSCQHGVKECFGNILQACAFHHYDFIQALELVKCSFSENDIPENMAIKCSKSLDLDYEVIKNCANSDEGMELFTKMEEKTLALNHPLTFVPWVSINGDDGQDVQDLAEVNLAKAVCDAYKGPKPKACL